MKNNSNEIIALFNKNFARQNQLKKIAMDQISGASSEVNPEDFLTTPTEQVNTHGSGLDKKIESLADDSSVCPECGCVHEGKDHVACKECKKVHKASDGCMTNKSEDMDTLSDEDVLEADHESAKSPEQKLIHRLQFADIFAKEYPGKSAEEIAKELGLEEDSSVVSLIENLIDPKGFYQQPGVPVLDPTVLDDTDYLIDSKAKFILHELGKISADLRTKNAFAADLVDATVIDIKNDLLKEAAKKLKVVNELTKMASSAYKSGDIMTGDVITVSINNIKKSK